MGLDLQQRRTLTWAGLAVVLTAFDGSVLVLALPAIAADFHAQTPALSNLGSVLALGVLGALPLSTLADRFGRRRLIAGGGGGRGDRTGRGRGTGAHARAGGERPGGAGWPGHGHHRDRVSAARAALA